MILKTLPNYSFELEKKYNINEANFEIKGERTVVNPKVGKPVIKGTRK